MPANPDVVSSRTPCIHDTAEDAMYEQMNIIPFWKAVLMYCVLFAIVLMLRWI